MLVVRGDSGLLAESEGSRKPGLGVVSRTYPATGEAAPLTGG